MEKVTKNNAKIILLTGGSFQGKSIVAVELAYRLRFLGVVTTDAIRNVLRIQYPNKAYLSTPTYLMPPPLLDRQMQEVSSVIKKMIEIYQSRGEHVVIEGMHFSDKLIEWISSTNYCKVCINNILPIEKRMVLKSKTRSNFRFVNSHSSDFMFGQINESNVNKTAYIKYKNRIAEIHNSILDKCYRTGFFLVEFSELQECIETVIKHVCKWYSLDDSISQ